MHQHASLEILERVWKAGFPGQIPDRLRGANRVGGVGEVLNATDMDEYSLNRMLEKTVSLYR